MKLDSLSYRYFTFIILIAGLFFSSCSLIDNIGFKYFPDDYVFTRADGTTYQTWNMAKDGKGFKNRTSLRMREFNKEDINKNYNNLDSMVLQELTVENLKSDFNEFEYDETTWKKKMIDFEKVRDELISLVGEKSWP
ncbi:MAG: hypothetical protein K9H64_01780 [Bacteroidales bacterium]|nr:hypothetical protein [Bacteroidales bacterium]MCF8454724.1 hypothetical protein [Bacteroidales bacterium]